jgi:hypothetical protein
VDVNAKAKRGDVVAAADDFRRRTLSHAPRALDRLIYLASMRDYNTGLYHHEGLAARYSQEAACEAVSDCHREAEHVSHAKEESRADETGDDGREEPSVFHVFLPFCADAGTKPMIVFRASSFTFHLPCGQALIGTDRGRGASPSTQSRVLCRALLWRTPAWQANGGGLLASGCTAAIWESPEPPLGATCDSGSQAMNTTSGASHGCRSTLLDPVTQ